MDLSKLLPWNWFRTSAQDSAAPPPPAGSGLNIVIAAEEDDQWPAPDSLEAVYYELTRLFDHDIGSFGLNAPHLQASTAGRHPGIVPRTRQTCAPDCYTFEVELPGVREQDITLSLKGTTLSLRAPRLALHTGGSGVGGAAYSVAMALERDADLTAIKPSFQGWRLSISVPRLGSRSNIIEECE